MSATQYPHTHDHPSVAGNDSSPDNTNDAHKDGIDRRGFLSCMAWAGTGLVWAMSGGVPTSKVFGETAAKTGHGTDFTFVQISDSHIGFNKAANPDVAGTLQAAVDKINALPSVPDLMLHTGDITQTARA